MVEHLLQSLGYIYQVYWASIPCSNSKSSDSHSCSIAGYFTWKGDNLFFHSITKVFRIPGDISPILGSLNSSPFEFSFSNQVLYSIVQITIRFRWQAFFPTWWSIWQSTQSSISMSYISFLIILPYSMFKDVWKKRWKRETKKIL